MEKILLVGDIANTFTNSDRIGQFASRQCNNILDAITLSRQENFRIIFVTMSNLGGELDSKLGTLRQVNHGAKIVLLAQMYEEPKARRLIRTPRNLENVADDYFICPVDIELLGDNGNIIETSQHKQQIRLASNDHQEHIRIKELEALATKDDLTGLKNRRYVREFLKQIIKRAKKEELRLTLFIFDIDDFKHYNDAYGHAIGDIVLKQAATMMRRCCRSHDIIGRIGGDEFAVVFWDCPKQGDNNIKAKQLESERRSSDGKHPQEAFFMSERFRKEISSANFSFLGPEGKGELTVSGGLASFPHDSLHIEELFEQADKAMLDAKRSGKNRIYLVGSPG